jgi:ketosteroid isomerase-like protein
MSTVASVTVLNRLILRTGPGGDTEPVSDREAQVRAVYEAFNSGEFAAAADLVSPRFEWHPNAVEPDTAVRRGTRDSMARAQDVISAFDDFHTEIEAVRTVGDRLAVAVRHRARPPGASDHVDRREAHLWTFVGDRAVSLREYPTLDAAVEAAGELGAGHGGHVRGTIAAYNSGDFERVLSAFSEDVTWKRVDGLPDEGGTIHGRDALRELFLPDAWSRQRFEPLELVERGDTVLVRGIFHAVGAGSGIGLDVEAYTVYRFGTDGLAHTVEHWRKREDAERSSGLRFAGAAPDGDD